MYNAYRRLSKFIWYELHFVRSDHEQCTFLHSLKVY